MSEKIRLPEMVDTFVVRDNNGPCHALVVTQVDYQKEEGRFKFFHGRDCSEQAQEWIDRASRMNQPAERAE